jgi:hypothetical protein
VKTKIHISNKKGIAVLILNLIVYSLAAIFAVNPVKAENGPILSPELRHVFYPSFVGNNASENIGPLQVGFSGQPYMAGYMTTDYLLGNPVVDRATAVRVTVSFKGTDNSIIQDGNALAAGIAAQGPSTSGSMVPPVSPYIDYGYTMLLVVDNQYDWPYIEGTVWEIYEWGENNMWPVEQPVAYLVAQFSWEFPYVLKMDSEVTLIIKWNSNPDVLSYSAIIDDYPEYPIYALIPADIQLHYFMLGTEGRNHPIIPLTGTVKFFQFPGAWSNKNIGQVGWHSYLDYPGFIRTGESSWTNVTFAYSVNGTTSWLDNTVNWGGTCYDNVNADYTYQHVHFYPTSDGSTLEPDTLLWSPPVCAVKTRMDGYFYIPTAAKCHLKIASWFTDNNLIGDRQGAPCPYETINIWPDGYTGADDIFFVASHFGISEGEPNWNHMADVIADRYVGIDDIFSAALCFGREGTYYYNFMGITIAFNTGEEIPCDNNGFVTIPQGATSFTVKRYGDPVGTTAIFWSL